MHYDVSGTGECRIPVEKDQKTIYSIWIRRSFEDLAKAVGSLDLADRRICVITDSNVGPLYAKEVLSRLEGCCREVYLYTIPAGEAHKNLEEIQKIYRFLISRRFDRKDILAALGGGVTGDMTGYAAATYLRGIRFIQIPTTLLAQVDSSIGGKTGVDFEQWKNMVGAFHQPSLVYINVHTLQTLDEDQFSCGMGEVLKHGLIRDASYYTWIIGHMEEISGRDEDVMIRLVEGSCLIKREVVQKDPDEKGERALLNFGHTIGHAIEKLMNFTLLHGQCVSLGMVAAAWISWKRGCLDADEFYEIRDMNVGFGLPITYEGPSPEAIVEATKLDKKMDGGKIRFILLKTIGEAVIAADVTDEEMLQALKTMDAKQLMRE